MPLTYAFRLAPGAQARDQAMLAEKLGYERVWSPEVPAFGHDIWVHLARIAERTQRIGIGPAVLIPSYRHRWRRPPPSLRSSTLHRVA